MTGRGRTFVALIVSLVAAACGSSSTSAPAANPQSFAVQVDGKASAFNAEFIAYFPNELKVHPGDTVTFNSIFRGEPHTVAFGSLVNNGLDAYDKAAKSAPNPQEVDESTIPDLAKIPEFFPQGPGDFNQTVVNPCYLENGAPPSGGVPCTNKQLPTELKGTESFVNSGFLADGQTFSLKLANNIKPGSYRYFCTAHREGMEGKIDVVPAGQSVQTPEQATSTGNDQLQKKVQALTPNINRANQGIAPQTVLAGVLAQDVQDAAGILFGPKDITVPVGGSVKWDVLGFHTISFNAPADATPVIVKMPDGSFHANPKAGMPVGTAGVPQTPPSGSPSPSGAPGSTSASAAPSASASSSAPSGSASPAASGSPAADIPGLPPFNVVNLGSWNGTGEFSSGAVNSFPPQLSAVKLTFTKAGTYTYKCLVHPDMEGSVKVGSA